MANFVLTTCLLNGLLMLLTIMGNVLVLTAMLKLLCTPRVLLTVTVLVTFVVLLLFYVVTLTRSFFNYHPRCNDIKQFHVCSSVFDQF